MLYYEIKRVLMNCERDMGWSLLMELHWSGENCAGDTSAWSVYRMTDWEVNESSIHTHAPFFATLCQLWTDLISSALSCDSDTDVHHSLHPLPTHTHLLTTFLCSCDDWISSALSCDTDDVQIHAQQIFSLYMHTYKLYSPPVFAVLVTRAWICWELSCDILIMPGVVWHNQCMHTHRHTLLTTSLCSATRPCHLSQDLLRTIL